MIIKIEDNKDSEPFYIQVYKFITEEIKSGRLKCGERLPSKKELCRDLGLSQTTIENAYEMLLTEGYVSSVPRKGYFVQVYEKAADTGSKQIEKSETGAVETEAEPAKKFRYDLSTGTTDISAFPFATWARLQKNVLYNEPELLNRGEGQGDMNFRQELVRYLHQYRGVNAEASQIICGAGTEYLLSLLCRILPEDTVFSTEDPGYMRIADNIEKNRMKAVPIAVGRDGIDLPAMMESGAEICYVTPSHQFPTGVTMPVGNRMRLLKWAMQTGDRYILEDDYDSEFRFAGRPVPSLQSLDTADRVIYIGTFSRSMAPSIRISYMILPHTLLKIYFDRFAHSACTVSRFEQQTLTAFLSGGFYERHINRMRTLYRKKSGMLIENIRTIFEPGTYELFRANAGMHFLMRISGEYIGQDLKARAEAEGLRIALLSDYTVYSRSNSDDFDLVVGFAGMNEADMPEAVQILKKAAFGG